MSRKTPGIFRYPSRRREGPATEPPKRARAWDHDRNRNRRSRWPVGSKERRRLGASFWWPRVVPRGSDVRTKPRGLWPASTRVTAGHRGTCPRSSAGSTTLTYATVGPTAATRFKNWLRLFWVMPDASESTQLDRLRHPASVGGLCNGSNPATTPFVPQLAGND